MGVCDGGWGEPIYNGSHSRALEEGTAVHSETQERLPWQPPPHQPVHVKRGQTVDWGWCTGCTWAVKSGVANRGPSPAVKDACTDMWEAVPSLQCRSAPEGILSRLACNVEAEAHTSAPAPLWIYRGGGMQFAPPPPPPGAFFAVSHRISQPVVFL